MTDQPGANQQQLNLSDPGQGPQLALVLEPDLKSMHLRIGRDGKLMAGIVLSADHLEGLIGNLTQIRERMLPAPPARTTVPEPAATPPTTAAPPPASPRPPHSLLESRARSKARITISGSATMDSN